MWATTEVVTEAATTGACCPPTCADNRPVRGTARSVGASAQSAGPATTHHKEGTCTEQTDGDGGHGDAGTGGGQ